MTIKNPKRGEIWSIDFDPTIGVEIKKIRPGVIISSNAAGKLPIKLTVPITNWKSYFAGNFWHIKVKPNKNNNLSKVSAIDTLQTRGVDIKRFIRKIGELSEEKIQEITLAIATLIEY